MDISQADKGISVITDSKYGWHVRDNHVQLSLLKSPKNPDGMADMHKHYIYYAVMPHKGGKYKNWRMQIFRANCLCMQILFEQVHSKRLTLSGKRTS